jgi:hypothetical protein
MDTQISEVKTIRVNYTPRLKRIAALSKTRASLKRWRTRQKRANTMVAKLETAERRHSKLLGDI